MRFLTVALLALAVGCVPAFEPVEGAAPGVTLTRVEREEWTTFRVETEQPLDRVFLRFVGTDLQANALECEVVAGALECIVGEVESFFEVHVAGTVTNDWSLPAGVACRADACHAITLAD